MRNFTAMLSFLLFTILISTAHACPPGAACDPVWPNPKENDSKYLEINGSFSCYIVKSHTKVFDLKIGTEIKDDKATYAVTRTYSPATITSFSILAVGKYFQYPDGYSRYATATKDNFALAEKDGNGGAMTANYTLSADGTTLYSEGFAGMQVNGTPVVMKTDYVCNRK